MQIFGQDFVFFTERRQSYRICIKIRVIFGVRLERQKVDKKQTYMKAKTYKRYARVF